MALVSALPWSPRYSLSILQIAHLGKSDESNANKANALSNHTAIIAWPMCLCPSVVRNINGLLSKCSFKSLSVYSEQVSEPSDHGSTGSPRTVYAADCGSREDLRIQRADEFRGHMNPKGLKMQCRANHLESVEKICLWRACSQLVAHWAYCACAEKLPSRCSSICCI